MRSTFKVLFYLRKNYLNKEGKAGIMIRLTVDGEIVQFSAKLDVEPDLWDTKNGKVAGKNLYANKLNATLDNIKAALITHYQKIERYDGIATAEKIRNTFLGIEVKTQTLLDLFRQHNENVKALVGISKSPATLQKYEIAYRRVENFMKHQYNVSDINLREINHMFLSDFDVYLKTICNCGQNTTAKFIQRLRSIVLLAKNNGWIQADPFVNYKIKFEKVDRGYLTQEEVEVLMQKSFTTKRLEHVRDIFVFSCFCGLAYIDVKNLRESNVRTSFDGGLWIMGKREKTGVSFNIPLLEVPKIILEKYKGTLSDKLLLPVMSNQKMNAYLKEIATLCGIEKELTFHLARHTFATLTLSKGVSIESVSKMLGHSNIKTTQIYARITDAKIGNDMAMFAGKMKGVESKLVINQ